MMLKKMLRNILERNRTVVVPLNCNAPEEDDDYPMVNEDFVE